MAYAQLGTYSSGNTSSAFQGTAQTTSLDDINAMGARVDQFIAGTMPEAERVR